MLIFAVGPSKQSAYFVLQTYSQHKHCTYLEYQPDLGPRSLGLEQCMAQMGREPSVGAAYERREGHGRNRFDQVRSEPCSAV